MSFLVPQAPLGLDIHVSNPEVTLAWKPPLKPNGIMVGYQVTVRKLPMGQVNIIDVNHRRLEQVFEALDLDAKYQFALLAKNRVGFGPPLVVNLDLKTGKNRNAECGSTWFKFFNMPKLLHTFVNNYKKNEFIHFLVYENFDSYFSESRGATRGGTEAVCVFAIPALFSEKILYAPY